jgi:predicted regulator of amino acid metabolism with ACT domain
MADRVRTEEFRVDGDKVVAKVKELVNEGNVRRIILRTEDGKDLIEVPLTIGVGVVGVGVLVAPVLAAIGAIAAIVARLSIVVERVEDKTPPKSEN